MWTEALFCIAFASVSYINAANSVLGFSGFMLSFKAMILGIVVILASIMMKSFVPYTILLCWENLFLVIRIHDQSVSYTDIIEASQQYVKELKIRNRKCLMRPRLGKHECCCCLQGRICVSTFYCQHTICTSCASRWYQQSHACPICRVRETSDEDVEKKLFLLFDTIYNTMQDRCDSVKSLLLGFKIIFHTKHS